MLQANQAWITMFRRIPANLHDSLILGLTTGAELVMQRIVRLEPDFMIIRGRLSGTQDAGRVVMIPYEQLTYVALTYVLKDAEIEAIFGKSAPVVVIDQPAQVADQGGAPMEVPPIAVAAVAEPAAVSVTAVDGKVPKKPEQTSKAVLLAKLRERLKEAK